MKQFSNISESNSEINNELNNMCLSLLIASLNILPYLDIKHENHNLNQQVDTSSTFYKRKTTSMQSVDVLEITVATCLEMLPCCN